MARRLSNCLSGLFCFAFVTAYCCVSSAYAVQADQHAIFPSKLDRVLDFSSEDKNLPPKETKQARKSTNSEPVILRPGGKAVVSHNNMSTTNNASNSMSLNGPAPSNPRPIELSAKLPVSPFSSASTTIKDMQPKLDSVKEVTAKTDWFGTVMTFPAQTESGAKIVVHQPDSMPGNEFSFIVENVGSQPAQEFSVEFKTPADVKVLRAFPFNAEHKPNSVVVNFERLQPGDSSPVHLKTTSSRSRDFVIETHIVMEKVHSFKVISDELEMSTAAHQTAVQQSDVTDSANPYQLVSNNSSDGSNQPSRPAYEAEYEPKKSVLMESSETGENATLSTSVSGSENLIQGQEEDFEITIANPTHKNAQDIIVQLTLPPGLMITSLDRQAWIDQELRTISWKIESMPAMQMDKIRYRVEAVGTTEQMQKVVVGMNNVYQGEIQMTSSINVNEPSQASVSQNTGN